MVNPDICVAHFVRLLETVRALRANDISPAQIRAMLNFILTNEHLVRDFSGKEIEKELRRELHRSRYGRPRGLTCRATPRLAGSHAVDVTHGPFKGLRLGPIRDQERTHRASLLLGLFEKEILDALNSIPSNYNTFINLGAGQGYYGIGVLANNTFEISHCYEILEEYREHIEYHARLNKVHGRVKIHGRVQRDSFEELRKNGIDLSRCVILCDIEGGEFELFDESTLEILKRSIIIIEIHDFLLDDGEAKLRNLKQSATKFFQITELTTGARDLSQFPEIKMLSDTERWLIVSEIRPRLMTWLRLDPK
jgi:hypothetical protein